MLVDNEEQFLFLELYAEQSPFLQQLSHTEQVSTKIQLGKYDEIILLNSFL